MVVPHFVKKMVSLELANNIETKYLSDEQLSNNLSPCSPFLIVSKNHENLVDDIFKMMRGETLDDVSVC